MGKGFQGQARAGWSSWDIRMNMMESHRLQGCAKLESPLPPVFWAMETEVSEKSQLGGGFSCQRPGVVLNSPESVILSPASLAQGRGSEVLVGRDVAMLSLLRPHPV